MHGLRDDGLLQAALARRTNLLAYGDPAPDLFDLAATYAHGLARSHTFNDGNKRTAWACFVLFLALDGTRVWVPAADTVAQVVDLARGTLTEAGFAGWLRGMGVPGYAGRRSQQGAPVPGCTGHTGRSLIYTRTRLVIVMKRNRARPLGINAA